MDRVITFSTLWDRVWARRRLILLLVIPATVLVGIVAFILPPWYQAETELMPPREEESGVGLTTLLRGVGVPGVRVPGQVTPADVFMAMLDSRRINGQVVSRFDLKKLYNVKYTIDAIEELKRHARFKLTAAGTVQITVEDKDRQRAADMANAYVEFLDRFNRDVRMTKGRRARLFIESRLTEIKDELTAAEQRLAEYQAKNKAVSIAPGMSSTIQQAARLYARRTELLVRLGVIRGYSQGSEEEIQIRQELAQLDQQMRQLPGTGLELSRLVREVTSLQQVFAFLTAQYEDAKITEARDIVTVDVLDEATPPEKKVRPKRMTMIAAAFLLSLALGVGLSVLGGEEQPRPLMRSVSGE
jgi:tyrosine-protein kinase Etk/Wzc